MKINLQTFDLLLNKIVAHSITITLAIENPRIKPALAKKLVKGLLELGEVTYCDYDLQFSSSMQNISDEAFSSWFSKGLAVLQPGDDPLDLVSASASLAKMKSGGVLILDSINTLQALFAKGNQSETPKRWNYKSSILLSVLQVVARSLSKSLLIFDLTKLRPRIQTDRSVSWEKELVGGRMIRYKSDTILFVSESSRSKRERNTWEARGIELSELGGEEKAYNYSVDL